MKSVIEADTDQDTCRICSAPAEPDQPLFHPCKCSGTIRYIHQDCLTTWLSHSKKKTCDVCKHPYSFTKGKILLKNSAFTYDTPHTKTRPAGGICNTFLRSRHHRVLCMARHPTLGYSLDVENVLCYGQFHCVVDQCTSAIAIILTIIILLYNLTSRSQFNSTATHTNTTRGSSNDTDASTWSGLLAQPLVRSVSADIFTGQIIATLIVLVFIAVFLLREWISQNARPGIFEEGDPAIVAEREAEQERERQQQRLREQVRPAMDIQLRRRQHAEAERLPRTREGGDSHQPDPSRRHPDQPSQLSSQRAHELRAVYVPQIAQLDQVESSSDAAGPSSSVLPVIKDDQSTSYLQARQEWLRAAEKRRLFALASTSSTGERQGSSSQDDGTPPSVQARGFDNAIVGNGKGKAKAIDPDASIYQDSISVTSNAASVLASLKQKRVAWGIPGAESWNLYDFERFEMTRHSIDLMFSPHGM
ncbi:hypothetical protein BJV77DRAFT_791315 [Russula vinacea]|nr:hypothetical protein BJV77DRAFT_791315 [Russula vinacea]